MPPEKTPTQSTLYFAFGSNLWLSQMRTRCPSSTYLGIARLNNHTWHINERGYANVVATPPPSSPPASQPQPQPQPHVYGLVYRLSPPDEARLDRNEGVPTAYEKAFLPVDYWPADTPFPLSSSSSPPSSTFPARITTSNPPADPQREMLVYIDRRRVGRGVPKAEYVYRMNRGVEDAVRLGVPGGYVEGVVRGYVPVVETEGVEGLARAQAGGFVDAELGVDGGVSKE